LLDRARRSESAVLVIRGDAGVGKSALLVQAVAQSDGMTVLRAMGVESEAELPFAGLHQVVRALLERVHDIPAPQAVALSSALGLSGAGEHDPFLVSAATLSLLAAAAEQRPVLCVVDDAQWLDDASKAALTFVARRLHAEPIAMLFAAREGERRSFEAAGLPELTVDALDPEAASALLAERAGDLLAPLVRERILESAAGNPLALLELPHALSERQRAGSEPLEDVLPMTETIERAFLARARRLPGPARTLLVLAAADDTADASIVFAAARALGITSDSFDQAEEARLLRVRDGLVEFRHPLVRSAVYHAATFAERQAVHGVLADALADRRYEDRLAWHRAAATLGTDAGVADLLEQSAERSRRRSGYGAAAAALERAAALTPDDDDETRARRLAGAAEAAWSAGRHVHARSLVDAVRRLPLESLLRADVEHLRGLIEVQAGVPRDGHAILLAAVDGVAALDPERAAAMLVSAGHAASFAGDLEGEIAAGRRAERLRDELSLKPIALTMMTGIARLLSGDVAGAAPCLREAIDNAEASDSPWRLFWAGASALYLLDMPAARAFFSRAADEARAEGAIGRLTLQLQLLAQTDLIDSRFASGAAYATEALPLARETGQENAVDHLVSLLAWAHGYAGREDDCRRCAAEVFERATERGLGMQASFARLGLGELELGLGRSAEALAHFEALRAAGPGEGHEAFKRLVVPSLVEAGVRAGRSDVAQASLAAYEDWVTHAGTRSELPRLERARGLLLQDGAAAAHYEEALRLHAEVGRPFERARTHFVYGEALRRAKQRGEARGHLRAALETFEQVGSASWADRARAELRASGESTRRRDPSTLDQLTPQELQIARLVAAGATNKAVAAQLFLSPRTIDFHMRSIFTKLGITSRTQLGGFALDEAAAGTSAAAAATA
jgi:DNA-binding CsgD family transcriptional regulator